ncbi:hypothetical protein Q4543_14855 [Salipiger sp. 1_MG-2023]|uniref:hypothetical protein n=1 Tax=Salipiger sp. 1_MG-2023 TaxID=3062665 RepID=UPI0026E21A21|nr:hypothetical protein [Salipiger sp. 1_MG-2023]MDO6586791.1 hypothetical protein [Salipiger sp. 1_MG-2023]
MKTVLMMTAAALALASCAPSVPDSGVGFEDYQTYAQRQQAAEQAGAAPLPGIRPGQSVVQAPTGAAPDSDADATARVRAAAANSGITPLEASPGNTPPPLVSEPQVVTNAAGISNENSFEAVSAERDIGADAALIAQNRSQYHVVAPTDLPPRPDGTGPNVVEYALRTSNPVGSPMYDRKGRYDGNRISAACNAYASPDLAQAAFLSEGGPQKDRKGLDPDGDGFACSWDPAPFRAARGG